MTASFEEPSLPNEWVLLNNLDQATMALQSVVSLATVLADAAESDRYRTSTFDDAMAAFTTYLDECVTKVAVCKELLFKQYRERKGIPETNASAWWSPAALSAKPAAKKAAAKKSVSNTKKKGKSNVKK